MAEIERLGLLTVLIVDSDVRSAQMTRTVLSALGVTRTQLARGSDDTLMLLKNRNFDLLVVEWNIRPLDGLELTRLIRTAPDSPCRMIPIVMVSSNTGKEPQTLARNAGVHEFITKPFSTRELLNRLGTIIDKPKSFIIAAGYVGPDRRTDAPPPPGVEERRKREGAIEPIVISAEEVNTRFDDGLPRVIMPDHSLRNRLERTGVTLAGLEHVMAREEAVKHTADVIPLVIADINALRQSMKQIMTDPSFALGTIARMQQYCRSIRSRAEPLDYTLGVRVANLLHDFCRTHFRKDNPQHLIVIAKHIDTLNAVFSSRLKGDGGNVGRELLEELLHLIERYTR